MKNIGFFSVALMLCIGLASLAYAAERMVVCELSYSEG